MGSLRIIRAGAGSGKTTRLCEVVAEAVVGGLDPARILATTFTRKSAAELKGRIQARLLAHAALAPAARVAMAERLELAAIGTVHSVGHQLLSRYALPLGFSPRLRVLEEAGGTRALHEVLAEMPAAPWAALAEIARRFSMKDPQGLVLQLLNAKRGNRIADGAFREQMGASAEELVALMTSKGPLADAPDMAGLRRLAGEVLAEVEGLADDTKVTREARQALRRLRDGGEGAWADYCRAAGLAAGKRSKADAAVGRLRAAAAGVLGSAALHGDLRDLLGRLAEQTLALERTYDQHKRARGFLDFTDLEVWLLRLLERPELAASLAADLALVVVDEFHDTNPLQLAIFQRLRGLVEASCWVGDSKQSIYGFRGADPELVRAVWDAVPESARDRLEVNYRSQAGLVRLVGRLFGPRFPGEAVLRPHREGAPGGVERWVIAARNAERAQAALAAGIGGLRDRGRPLREIAVLCRTNDQAAQVGSACRAAGIPAILALPGLLATREGALALAGLRLVADRSDSLAAATVLHLLDDPGAETPAWLAERLRAVGEQEARGDDAAGPPPAPWAGDPRLAPLEAIDHRQLPPTMAVQRVLEALRAGEAARRWGSAAERLANLDALLGLAAEYEAEAATLGSAATLAGLVAFLEARAEAEQDLTRPPYGIEAVTVLTYHAAKGLEWPVVILTGLDFDREPDMWQPRVEGGSAAREDPLAGREIRYWPWPFGQVSRGTNLDDLALGSVEGEAAVERAEAEALRLLYVGCTRAEDVLVLAHREGQSAWLERLEGVDRLLPTEGAEGERRLEDLGTSYILRRLDGEAAGPARAPAGRERWLEAPPGPPAPRDALPRYWSPSQAEEQVAAESVTVALLPGEPVFPRLREEQEPALGNAVHAYLTALPSLAGLGPAARGDVAARCLAGHGVEGLLTASQLVAMGQRLEEWVEATYPGAAWQTEVPVSAPRRAGGQWSGSVDLLLRLPRGVAVVVDHKSSPIPRAQLAPRAAAYAGQLAAYREALAAQPLQVAATWIHFPLAGGMARIEPRAA